MLQSVEGIIEELRIKKPDVIYGYPSILSILAREIKEKNITGISPRIILTHAETQSDHSRQLLADAFKSDVYDTYGCVEFSGLAFECRERSGYHMISDSVIVEFVKGDNKITRNEPGEIVVTSLYNYEMPLIRYKLGDVGIFKGKKCTCGRGLPLISTIEGRCDDFIVLPSGIAVSPRGIKPMTFIPGIAEFRIIQEKRNRVIIQVVKGEGFGKDTVNQIKKHVRDWCLGEDVTCEIELVDKIPRERTGKIRSTVSKIRKSER